MTLSDTPRTDALVITSETDDRLAGELVSADDARKLERELAALEAEKCDAITWTMFKARAEEAEAALAEATRALSDVTREREAMKSRADALVSSLAAELSDSAKWVECSDRMPVEADYAPTGRIVAMNSAGYATCVTGVFRTPTGWDGEDATPEETQYPIGHIVRWMPLPEAPK
jgi:hypothetical protein